jgi:hypothetical protein
MVLTLLDYKRAEAHWFFGKSLGPVYFEHF